MPKLLTSLLLIFGLLFFWNSHLPAQTCDVNWELINPKPSLETELRHITYGNDQFVAVGLNGVVLTSHDGLDWNEQNIGTTDYHLSDVIWNGEQFFVTANNSQDIQSSAIYTSPDGITWKKQVTEPDYLKRLAWNGQRVVALGDNVILNSPDGINWTRVEIPNYIDLRDIAGRNNQFVAVGLTDSSRGLLFTSPDGINWSENLLETQTRLVRIATNGQEFLAWGYNANQEHMILGSTDGHTWEVRKKHELQWHGHYNINRLVWNGQSFVVLGQSSNGFDASPDGKEWQFYRIYRISRYYWSLFDLATNGSRFVLISNRILTSTDNVHWISPIALTQGSIRQMTSNEQQFVALAYYSDEINEILNSPDGINWTVQPLDFSMIGSTWGNQQFVAIGRSTVGKTFALTSPDGIHWQQHQEVSDIKPKSLKIVWNGTQFVAVGSNQNQRILIMTSSDGRNWILQNLEQQNLDVEGKLYDIIWTGSQFVAVGEGRLPPHGLVLTSPDGFTWTKHEMEASRLRAIAYNGNQYVMIGKDGLYGNIHIYKSLDGIHWNRKIPQIFHEYAELGDIIWTGTEFIAIGSEGVILSSPNGEQWVQENSGTNVALTSIAVKDNDIVVGGDNGTILHRTTTPQNICTDDNYNGYQVTDELWIRAVIQTLGQGNIEAIWQQDGEVTTARGDRVIWGHFYASPDDVTWGNANNPDLFVKIWFDVNGRVDVNYFHVSVPPIDVYSAYFGTPDAPDKVNTTDMEQRYIRHYFNQDGSSGAEASYEDRYEDRSSPPDYVLSPDPAGYQVLNDLRIGTLIQTEEAGLIEGIWQLGGQAKTERGDEVAWGHFYADPAEVDWGDPNNPELMVKIWFDVNRRIDVNYFHVSVPDIGVFSEFPNDGEFDKQRGVTMLNDRYTQHRFYR